MKPIRLLMAAAEAVPYAKTGGLADMVGSLSPALSRLGVRLVLIHPFYRATAGSGLSFEPTGLRLSVPMGREPVEAEIWRHYPKEGFDVYLIKCDRYFDREGLYGNEQGDHPDNAERFIFFSRAVLEASRAVDFQPDVVHCHDWHTGLIPTYLSTLYREDPHYAQACSLFTLHNMGYQGLFGFDQWSLTSLPESLFTSRGLEFYGRINLLKGGMLFADLLTTVSRRYAKEIQTPEFGFGLEGILRERAPRLFGVMNGIDVREWDPSADPYIPEHYSPTNPLGKRRCKEDLQKKMGLSSDPDVPLLVSIMRLIEQKGVDLIASTFDEIMAMGVQFVMLGTGERRYVDLLGELSSKHPRQAQVRIAYDHTLAHRIEAGGDIFLMPSRYEPCGLNQLMSLRYGTVPLVRATGGLDDSVRPFSSRKLTGNGFKFKPFEAKAFLKTVGQAVKLYPKRPSWEALMQNGMRGDYSWNRSAKTYLKLYRQAMDVRKG